MAEDCDRTNGDHDAGPETLGQISDDRDQTSDARDDTAEARDDTAEARDDRAEARDEAVGRFDAGAASDRAEALRDRRGAAIDRAHAAADRGAASSDRVVSAGERAVSSIDGLTGAHRRDAGIVELERETARAKRTGQPFVLGFVDVDGLKATNDSLGHAAGDQLLRQIVDTIRANLRFYDLIVRFGGDEFLCGLLDLKMKEAAKRFLLVNADLAETQQASVTVGLAELKGDDSLKDLIMRADEALYRDRQQRPSAHAGRWLRSVR
jgi:diguanylate cyclase (GGDEF)-like protein